MAASQAKPAFDPSTVPNTEREASTYSSAQARMLCEHDRAECSTELRWRRRRLDLKVSTKVTWDLARENFAA